MPLVSTASSAFGLNNPQERVIWLSNQQTQQTPCLSERVGLWTIVRQSQASEILQCSWLGKFIHFILIQKLYITSLPLLNKLNFPVLPLLLTSPNQSCMADLFR